MCLCIECVPWESTKIDYTAMEKNLISNNGTVDEELLRSFFADSMRMHVADNGFSYRVMTRLQEEVPVRQRVIYNLWTVACSVLCIIGAFVSGSVGGFIDWLHKMQASLSVLIPRISWESTLSHLSWNSIASGFSWESLQQQVSASGATVLMVVVAVAALGTVVWYDMEESR